jgi:hypothetical protein
VVYLIAAAAEGTSLTSSGSCSPSMILLSSPGGRGTAAYGPASSGPARNAAPPLPGSWPARRPATSTATRSPASPPATQPGRVGHPAKNLVRTTLWSLLWDFHAGQALVHRVRGRNRGGQFSRRRWQSCSGCNPLGCWWCAGPLHAGDVPSCWWPGWLLIAPGDSITLTCAEVLKKDRA